MSPILFLLFLAPVLTRIGEQLKAEIHSGIYKLLLFVDNISHLEISKEMDLRNANMIGEKVGERERSMGINIAAGMGNLSKKGKQAKLVWVKPT